MNIYNIYSYILLSTHIYNVVFWKSIISTHQGARRPAKPQDLVVEGRPPALPHGDQRGGGGAGRHRDQLHHHLARGGGRGRGGGVQGGHARPRPRQRQGAQVAAPRAL